MVIGLLEPQEEITIAEISDATASSD
jgi:hypothetical protein